MGEGLWQLYQLVSGLKGSLWVLTGNAELLVTPAGAPSYSPAKLTWDGLVIEVHLPVAEYAIGLGCDSVGNEDIARRLGI